MYQWECSSFGTYHSKWVIPSTGKGSTFSPHGSHIETSGETRGVSGLGIKREATLTPSISASQTETGRLLPLITPLGLPASAITMPSRVGKIVASGIGRRREMTNGEFRWM